MKSLSASFFIVIFLLALVYGCVGQDQMSSLNSRIATLEKRLATQDAKLLEEEKKSIQLEARLDALTQKDQEWEENYRNQTAEVHATLDQMRGQIQTLRGKVEETEYSIRQKESSAQQAGGAQVGRLDRIESVSQKNEDRLYRIEQYLNLESMGKPRPKTEAAPSKPKVSTPEDLYQTAKSAFDSADYETARDQFEAFLKKYPKSKNADNAQFWIGETYYREKWYEKAILEYQKVIENYPKGNKVQASLLKQGLSFLNLGDKSNSRLILKELVKKYPKSNEAKVAQQKLKDIN